MRKRRRLGGEGKDTTGEQDEPLRPSTAVPLSSLQTLEPKPTLAASVPSTDLVDAKVDTDTSEQESSPSAQLPGGAGGEGDELKGWWDEVTKQ